MSLTPEAIGTALGRLPSGCSILTITRGEESTGVLLSWVQQAAFDPPSITFCLKRGRPVERLLENGARFLLNLLGDDPVDMFKHFGRGFDLHENAFAGLDVVACEFGPLLQACPAHLGGEVREKVAVGDHDLYIAQVVAARLSGDFKPYVHLRRNGLSY